jgi:ribosomal protein L12E/L44/L45/RPP1/RPP2
MVYVDNVVILGRSEGYTKKTLEKMAAVTQQIGLQTNDTKTKYLVNRQVGNKVKEIELRGKKYEKIEYFT